MQTKVGSVALCTNTYAARNNGLSLTTYGNGDTIQYTYNKLGLLGQVTRINNGNQQVFKWGYAADGTPITHRDIANNRRYHYQYDSLNRLVRQEIRTQDDAKNIGFVEQGYDLRNNVTKQIVQLGGRTIKQAYSYSAYSKNDADGNPIANSSASYAKDNLPTLYQISSTRYATYRYDSINRLNKRALSTIRPIYNNYVYKLSQRNDASSTDTEDLYRTNQLLRELVDNTAYQYTYDALGNITAITKGVRTNTDTDDTAAGGFTAYRSYGYDSLGQLTRENNATNNKTNVFAYDELGNITSKTEYDYTTGDLGSINKTILYGYSNDGKQGWNNLLTSVDLNGDGVVGDGETITYDEIGNPTTYLGNTLAWDGRHLTNYNNIAYSYDADGIRASKTIGTARTEYFYVGDKLVYQAVTNTATGDVTYEMYFFYDSYNHLTAIRYVAGATDHYYYVTTNVQGDVLGIYTAAGVLLASYEYDAWGNCTVTTHNANYIIGDLNPIRYRGYYYDTETGFYATGTRYYDPEIGRFISVDNQVSGVGGEVLGYNMFAYCMNNSVNMSDPTGQWPKWITGALNVVSGVSQMVAGAALGAFTSWTGVGAVAAGFLILNGSATATQGIGQIINDIAGKTIIREDNIVRTSVQEVGRAIGGDTGAKIAGGAYDVAVIAANIYAGKITGSPSRCFVAGTAVLTALGNKPIETIEVGDLVWSKNTETGESGLKKVLQTFVRESNELVYVYVNGEKIVTTPEHPFYVPTKGWTSAVHLLAGDILVLQNGKYVTVEKVQHEILEAPITVYNFEVADFHTYYVGKSSVLVHNTCGGNSSSKTAFPKNGTKVNSSVALDMADDFLGAGYTEVSPSRFVSADGFRQVRMANADILGLHGGGPHINFDRLYPSYKSVHIYIFDD